MDDNTLQFEFFDSNIISEFLLAQEKPVMEIQLLRLFNQDRFLSSNAKKLYSLHFSLYHALYRLKQDAGNAGYYLHLDPMRIRMLLVPVGRCFHYDEYNGRYCGKKQEQGNYCINHYNDYVESLSNPVFDPLRDFYLNEDNIVFGGSDLFNMLMRGVVMYAFKKDEISQALEFFGIEKPSKKKIQNKYYELAKKYHPDKNYGNDDNMRLLNKSYQVLKEVFVL